MGRRGTNSDQKASDSEVKSHQIETMTKKTDEETDGCVVGLKNICSEDCLVDHGGILPSKP